MRKENELSEVGLFAGCRPDELRWIGRLGDTLDLPAGRTLCSEGSTAREFVVVVRGAVVATNGHGPAVYGPGSHFGEMGLVDGGSHSETVVTETPVRLLVFEARAFRGLLERAPSVSRKLLRELVHRVRADQSARSLRAVS